MLRIQESKFEPELTNSEQEAIKGNARNALKHITIKNISPLVSYMATVVFDLTLIGSTKDFPNLKARIEWVNNHPIVQLMAHLIRNLACPNVIDSRFDICLAKVQQTAKLD